MSADPFGMLEPYDARDDDPPGRFSRAASSDPAYARRCEELIRNPPARPDCPYCAPAVRAGAPWTGRYWDGKVLHWSYVTVQARPIGRTRWDIHACACGHEGYQEVDSSD